MRLRIYLDTSVFSARFDERALERQIETEEFWKRLEEFEAATSDLAVREIEQTPDPHRRRQLAALLREVAVHPITHDMLELAQVYVDSDVFTINMVNDAVHVAAAVLTRQNILVSWNFRHLVNRRRRAKINEVNTSRGVPGLEILAPPEI